jgi:hypothetical protein
MPIWQNGHGQESNEQCYIDQPGWSREMGQLLSRGDSSQEGTDSEVGQLLENERTDTHHCKRPDVRSQAQPSWDPLGGQYDSNEKKRCLAENGYGLSEPRLEPEYAYRPEREADAKHDQEIECCR